MRTFAIISTVKDVKIGENIISKLPNGSKVVVFAEESRNIDDFSSKIHEMGQNVTVEARFYPDELVHHMSRIRNFVAKSFFDDKTTGFLHIIDERTEIFNDPNRFMDEIERMMTFFGLKSWFNTSCDGCNYVYSKYNPRLYIEIDEPEAAAKYQKRIAWCSNANTQWVIFNMDTATFEDVRLEERFDFGMYYIIEFLARRRNTKKPGQLDYMNYYPSVEEELDVFRGIDVSDEYQIPQEQIKREDEIFHEMKVDNTPDRVVDVVMEDMRNEILRH